MQDARRSYHILGTLGDAEGYLTCSMHVARKIEKANLIRPYAQFEDGVVDLKSGNISCLLVPGAYPKIGSFIMDSQLEVAETFVERIPSLVLCGVADQCPAEASAVIHHPATTYLLPEIGVAYGESVPASSNPEACRMLLREPRAAVAITNQPSAEFYNLAIYKVLREGIRMPWVCFITGAEDLG
jgi:prephenate dehydratase